MWYLLAELAVLLALAVLLGLIVGWLLWRWRRPSIKASEYQKLVSERDRYARGYAESQYRSDQLEENLQSAQAQSGRALSERDHYEGLLAESESEAERLRQERVELVQRLETRPVPKSTIDLTEPAVDLTEPKRPVEAVQQPPLASRRPPAVRQALETRPATQQPPAAAPRPAAAQRAPVVEPRLSEVAPSVEAQRQPSAAEVPQVEEKAESANPFIVHATPSENPAEVEAPIEPAPLQVDNPTPTAADPGEDRRHGPASRGVTGLFSAREDEPTIEPYEPLSQADDLKVIVGIDERAETFLNQHGVSTYRQLGSLSEQRLAQMERKAPGLTEQMGQNGWIDQAQRLYNEKF